MKKLFFNTDSEDELRSLASQERTEDAIKRMQAIYDLADKLGDQRYGSPFTTSKKNRSRIESLHGLLTAIQDCGADMEDAKSYILFNLTEGNIYNRLSHKYREMFEYEMARSCARKAQEHLWYALQKAEATGGDAVNRLLIHLNLAKYYREWAALSRRSNYQLALRELDLVLDELEKLEKEILKSESSDKILERQLALIGIDAVLNKGRIYRHDYRLEQASGCLTGIVEALQECARGREDADDSLKKLAEISLGGLVKNKEDIDRIQKMLKYLDNEDVRIYLMSSYTQLSLALMKQRKYNQAQTLLEEIKKHEPHNRDIRNNLGVCYRKQCQIREAVTEFLGSVQKPQDGKVTGNSLEEFLKEEVRKIRKAKAKAIEDERKEPETEDNRFAYINLLKCVLNLYGADRQEHMIFTYALEIIDNRLKYYPNDFEVMLLKCRYLVRDDRIGDALVILEDMVKLEELAYVRRGTIGLKARNMLADCYLSQFRFSEAEKQLLFIRREVYKDRTKLSENQWDVFAENNIGWCLIQRGRDKEAKECYEKLLDNLYQMNAPKGSESSEKPSITDKVTAILGADVIETAKSAGKTQHLTREKRQEIEQAKNLSGLKTSILNNMGECYLRLHDQDANLEKAREIFDLILLIEPENGLAHLRRGYCETGLEEMAEWFGRAFRLASESVEVRSGYLINLVDRYLESGDEETKRKFSEDIWYFIRYVPYSYTINMCIALLTWAGKGTEEFYEAFSRIELYPELGTRAFSKLAEKSEIRYLTAGERGKLMAQLLLLYEPIVRIRRKCHYQYQDWLELVNQVPVAENGKSGRKRSGLVHYTSLDTLKALLDENGTPRLRVSNSGYMNDASEGEIFFEEMWHVLKDKKIKKNFDELMQCYFRERKSDPERVLPRGGNVYITSLSTQADSFPMWDIYGGKEQGCNIEFDEDFFDLKGNSWGVPVRKQPAPKQSGNKKKKKDLDYSISTYTDDDYPLYKIQYVYRDHYITEGQAPNPTRICNSRFSKTKNSQMDYKFLKQQLQEIAAQWNALDEYLKKLNEKYEKDDKSDEKVRETVKRADKSDEKVRETVKRADKSDEKVREAVKGAVSEARAFAADRLNEVRYLFKDRDYSFEGEVRLLRVVDESDHQAHTDARKIPRAFTEVDREIRDVVVTLASRLSDEQVNEITTWLKHTGKVKGVKLAMKNRARGMASPGTSHGSGSN